MILFPAIDLIGGKVVRLERGDRSRCKVYSDDPVAVARSFAEQGASWVHVVDLSAAFGEDEDACAANSAAIKAICGVDGLSADVGGGVRSLARIDELAGYGARRIALGTVLVTEPGFAEVAAQGFGELLVADIATRDGQVKVNGWRDGAGVALDDAVAQLTELGFEVERPADGHRRGGVSPCGRGRGLSRRGFGRHLDARRYPRTGRGGRGCHRGCHYRSCALRGQLYAGPGVGRRPREGVAHACQTRDSLSGC